MLCLRNTTLETGRWKFLILPNADLPVCLYSTTLIEKISLPSQSFTELA